MIIKDLQQGTPEWLAYRAAARNASEAAAVLNQDKYITRQELLRNKATGLTREIDPATQRLFDEGHKSEELARPTVSETIGEQIYPITAASDDGYLSASFDGVTMDESTIWENKLFNRGLCDYVSSNNDLPDTHWPQVEQQIMVSKASRCLFTLCSKNGIVLINHWYTSRPERQAQIMAAWQQFDIDKANYQHVEVKAAVTGAPIESLPAIIYTMDKTDLSITSNFDVYKAKAEALTERAKTPLVTDQDFADRDLLGKKFRESETMLKQKASDVVGQVVDVAAFSQSLLHLAEVHRKFAVDCENAVKAEKENRRADIIKRGRDALAAHVATWNTMLGKPYMPALGIASDFPLAIKGKSNLLKIQDAADAELARCTIIADATGKNIQINLNTLRDMASDCKSLFTDTAQIIHKSNDDLVALIKARIADNKAEIEAKEARRIAAQELADQAERVRIEAAEAKAKKAAEEAVIKAEAPIVEAVKPAADFPCVHRAGTGAPMPIIAEAAITAPALSAMPEEQAFFESTVRFENLNLLMNRLNPNQYEIAKYFFNAGFLAGKAS